MTEDQHISAEQASGHQRLLGLLLSMAMFVLVVDTSIMNVSISAVVRDLETTVSGVQSAIALEALVGAAAAIAAAVGPLLGGFITTYLSWRLAFGLEVVIIAVVLSGISLVRDVPYTGPRHIDVVGALLSVVGMGGIVLGILVWQEGGESVGAIIGVGAIALGALVYWLRRRKRLGKPTLLDPDLFRAKPFRLGVSQQMLQQIALGGTMIALPIYLQMVLEYNAMEAGLSLAPLSLSMFGIAILAGRKAGGRRPSVIIRW